MTKIALITDTHLGVRNDSPVFYNYFEKSFDFFFDTLKEQNVKTIIHGGDLYDRRKYLNYVTARLARQQFLGRIHVHGYKTHIICGNHDHYYKDTHMVNSLDEMVTDKYKPDIETYSMATEITIDGLDFLLIPWITKSNAEHAYDTIKNTHAEIVVGHLELNGFEMFRGMVSDHGDDKKLYNKFDLVMSGHYHHKSSNGNIHYLGAFMEHTWADYNDPKGFHIFDTETRKLEFYKNPYSIFMMLAYDDVKHTDIVQKIAATDYSKCNNKYVKIVCVNRTNQYAFDMMMDAIYKAGPIDVSIVEDSNTIADKDDSLGVDETQDTPTILSKYIENLTLPVDSAKMITYMKDVYSEALSVEHVG